MDAIPVVDLRLLSQAEINALSRASSSSAAAGDPRRRVDDIVVPKIDRSVFNESAGSRKQTYSRLRLAPRKPPDLSSPSPSSSSGAAPRRGRGRPPSSGLLPAPSPSSSAPPPAPPVASDDPGREENKQIILFLRQLFKKNGIEIGDAAAASEGRAAVPGTSVDANPNCVGSALGKRVLEHHAAEALTEDWEVLNVNGVAVDLFGLGEKEDPFGPELKRRTQGLVTEEEFLGFLNGLEGQWGSRRKRRRIVDAAKFGDTLPKGWKVLLALKRKERNIWLHCRRYISPTGKQFMSCKEVSSYLLSFVGSQEARQQIAAQSSANNLGNEHAVCHSHQVNITTRSPSCSAAMPISTISGDSGKQTGLSGVENPAKAQPQDTLKCQECKLTFADRGVHLQHLLTFHTSSRKRRRLGQSIGDGVIMRDGKYECQFCHKTFTERRRYTGHVGIHVKYHSKSLVPVTNEITLNKNIASSSDGVASSFGEHGISVDCGRHAKLIEEHLSTKSIHVINDSHPQGDEPIGNIVTDHTLKCCDNETDKIMVHEICTTGDIGEIKNSLPLSSSCDIDEERNVMKETCPLPNDEMNEGSPRNNVSLGNRKIEHNVKCSDIERSSVQEVCDAQCIGEINDGSPLSNNQNKLNKVDYFPISNNETSESRFIDNLANDYSMTDQKPRENSETGKNVNGDVHTYLDRTCLSAPDVGNFPSEGPPRNYFSNNKPIDGMEKSSSMEMTYERHSVGVSDGLQTTSEIVMSSGFVIDGAGNSENKICLSSNLNILSGKEQNNTRNSVAMCMTEELAEMAKSGNESENDPECMNTTSDVAFSLDNIACDKIQPPGTEKRLLENLMMIPSGKIYCDIDTATGDMLPSTGEEIMLDIMDQPSNGLEDDFISDDTVLDADSLRNDIGFSDEQNMQNLPVNMQASWGPTSTHLPILDMISGQADGNIHRVDENQEKISFSKDTRLDKIKPQKSVLSTDQDSRRRLEEQNAYSPMLENVPRPCVQLEWDLASPSLAFRRRITTYCVWCSTEFEHDDFDIEVQPDSVGLMCPTCKAKISGQL